ncbi:alpha/beta fold hydrolase [Streptomyces monticola]|uniref:Alpha/beta fold hydrolase n=1 Tax=Streptomyces monticola TaxID=2666263 RepID=A0ABW2JCU9_9ACTN
MHSFATEDGPLVYRDTGGTGRPLVLLHGGFVDHRMWERQVPFLARRFRVIAPDARGHGGSANASRPFRHTDDLAALLRHLDVGPAVLVGVSMGGAIAVDTALEHPGLVRAVIVSGVGTSEPEFVDPWNTGLQEEQGRALAAGDVPAWINSFTRFAAGPHRTLDDVDQDVVRLLRDMEARTIGKHTAAEPDWQVPVADTWSRAAKITVPVLAVNGALDSDDHLAMAERLARIVPEGRATSIEGTAHYPNMERPEAFNSLVQEFVRTLDADGR